MKNFQKHCFDKDLVGVRVQKLDLITIFNPYQPNQIDKINLIYLWVLLNQILYKGPIAAKIIFLTNH